MSDFEAYGLVCLGVITAVVFPVLASAVRKYFPKGQSPYQFVTGAGCICLKTAKTITAGVDGGRDFSS